MSDIWIRKTRTCFRAIDIDHDGIVSRKDFVLLNERWIAAIQDDPVQQEKMRNIINDFWLKFTSSTKTNEKELLTEAMFVDSLVKQRNDPTLKASFRDASRGFFEYMDTNKDGYVYLLEFRNGFDSMGIPNTSFAEQNFKFIDTNHDGRISIDEYSYAFLEFVFSEDENSPFNLLFGSLE